MKIRIKYNAPVTLTLIILCSAVFALNHYVNSFLISNWFTADGNVTFNYSDPFAYLKFISHLLGHQDLNHIMFNSLLLILTGPILEEKYSSKTILALILTTAIVSSAINAFFIDSYLLGASGIVYLFIVLISFTNIEKGEFPLSVVITLGIFLYNDLTRPDIEQISIITHLVGAIIGLLYGLITVMGGLSPASAENRSNSSQDVTIHQ